MLCSLKITTTRMGLCLCSFDLFITTNANVGPNWEICKHGPTKKFKTMINIIQTMEKVLQVIILRGMLSIEKVMRLSFTLFSYIASDMLISNTTP